MTTTTLAAPVLLADRDLLAWAVAHTPEPRWLCGYLMPSDREYLLREWARALAGEAVA